MLQMDHMVAVVQNMDSADPRPLTALSPMVVRMDVLMVNQVTEARLRAKNPLSAAFRLLCLQE